MSVIEFQYRDVDGKCKLIADFNGNHWESFIEQPYPFGHEFWSLFQWQSKVINKSKEIAKKYGAPEWVWE